MTHSDRRLNAETQRGRDAEGEKASAWKETEIGLLPADWEALPFTKAVQKKRIRAGKIKKRDYKPSGDFPIIDQGQDFIGGYWNDPEPLYEGDLPVVIFGDHTRVFKFVDFPFIRGADGVKVLIPNRKRFDPRFFYYACLNLEISSRGYSRHYKYLKEKLLPRPAVAEQRHIASALLTIQEAIAAQDDVIVAARELKRSLMERLFTYGASAEPAPTKETEIGEIPEYWDVVALGEIALIERGKFAHRPRNDPDFYGGATPFIQTGDVTASDGRITSYTQTLNDQGLSVGRTFPKGTIVITIAANIGYTGILQFECAFPDSLIGITPNETVDNIYLEYYLQTQQARMDQMAPQGTQKNINIQFLRPWPAPVAPPAEQEAIALILSSADAKIAAEEQRKAALEELFRSALEQLMTGQIRLNAETQRRGDAELL